MASNFQLQFGTILCLGSAAFTVSKHRPCEVDFLFIHRADLMRNSIHSNSSESMAQIKDKGGNP